MCCRACTALTPAVACARAVLLLQSLHEKVEQVLRRWVQQLTSSSGASFIEDVLVTGQSVNVTRLQAMRAHLDITREFPHVETALVRVTVASRCCVAPCVSVTTRMLCHRCRAGQAGAVSRPHSAVPVFRSRCH